MSEREQHRRALVVGDGEVGEPALRAALEGLDADDALGQPSMVIAADGGARHLAAVGRMPDLICGDGDSLGDEIHDFESRGVRIERYPTDKDQSDLQLAIEAAIRIGARRVDVHGALAGPRPEHSAANELLLASPDLDGVEVVLHHGESRFRRVGSKTGSGSVSLRGDVGDFVSLLALDDPVDGVVTDGLRFALRSEPLALGSTRGLSNELSSTNATIATAKGRLLVVETPRTAADKGGSR